MKKVLPLALAIVATGASASATEPQPRTVVLAFSPQNAAVAVDGHPRQHRNGNIELRGPLGAVFTVEVVANGWTVVEHVAITDVGALPARLVVPAVPAAALAGSASPVADECNPPTWRDAEGVKHFKAQCLALEEYGEPDARARPAGLGQLTIVCLPKCDRIVDNGVELGPGHIFNRPVVTGRHSLDLSAPNGIKRSVVVDVTPDQTKEVRVTMDRRSAAGDLFSAAIDEPAPLATWSSTPAAPSPSAGAGAGSATDEIGYLTLASYPWAKVSEGGRTLCLTPCAKIPLSPGVHFLVLDNESSSLSRSISVTITRGEITTKRFAFK